MGNVCVESEVVNEKTAERRTPMRVRETPRQILIADDEHLVATGVAANLKELGYQVVGPVSDGNEAVKLCRELNPDLALLDIRMPGLDGLDAATQIYETMNIPVIIFSAYSDPDEVKRCDATGIFGYLLKPVTRDQLRVGISVAWSRFRDHVELSQESDKLRRRLEERRIVEQAKWVLVKRKQIEEPEAMRLLQNQARNSRRPLVDVATGILESDTLFNGS